MQDAPFDKSLAQVSNDCNAYWVAASDKIKIRVVVWQSDTSMRGTVFLFPGRGDCLERLGLVANEFTRKGYAVIGVDWRGQGLSQRLAKNLLVGHIDKFSDYQKDVDVVNDVATKLALPKPYHLLAHSMGAAIGLKAIINGLSISSFAVTAPMFGVNISPVQRVLAWPLSYLAEKIGKGQLFVPGSKGQQHQSYVLNVPFKDNRLTNDLDMFTHMTTIAENIPEGQTSAPSLGWLFQTLKECKELSKLDSPKVPCVAFCGEDDTLVDISAVQSRMVKWPNGHMEMIANCKHDILSEVSGVRDKVLAEIVQFFERYSV